MDLTQLTILNAAIGTIALPWVIAAVNQPRWPTWGKVVTMGVVCTVVGTLTAVINGELVGLAWPTAIATCVISAVAAYEKIWKPAAKQFERATALPAAPVALDGRSLTEALAPYAQRPDEGDGGVPADRP